MMRTVTLLIRRLHVAHRLARRAPKRPVLFAKVAALPVLLVALGAPTPRLVGPDPVPAAPHVATLAYAASAVPRTGFLDYHETPVSDARLDAARLVNARIPFARVAVQAAAPFYVAGDVLDRARATDCLAAAGYYEAGSDIPGQRAVMQVVLNRVRHRNYPQSVCGVVFQGAERSTGCQFTFTCDGAMGRHRPSPAAWERARRTATEALNGYTDARVGHATHYHTDWVHPYWSSTLDKIAAVDTHLFFQARSERPSTFSAAYTRSEPRITRLGWLSSVHQVGAAIDEAAIAPTIVADVATLPEAPSRPAVERLPDVSRAPDEGVYLVTLDAGAGADSFLVMAQAKCAGRSYCKVIGWTDPRKRAQQFPIPGSSIDAISFSFNRANAGDTARWNCGEFPRIDAGQCLRRGG